MGDILEFRPADRQGDPDFPGIAELEQFHGDGGKARIQRRRRAIGLEHLFHGSAFPDDLTDTAPCEMAPPEVDT